MFVCVDVCIRRCLYAWIFFYVRKGCFKVVLKVLRSFVDADKSPYDFVADCFNGFIIADWLNRLKMV